MQSWIVRVRRFISVRHQSEEPKGAAGVVGQSWKPIGVIALFLFGCACLYYGVPVTIHFGKSFIYTEKHDQPVKPEPQAKPEPERQIVNREKKEDRVQQAKLFDDPVPMPRARPDMRERKVAKKDLGTYEVEMPVQGDNNVRYKGKQRSYVRDGVRFVVYTKRCNDADVIPPVCYIPEDRRHPLQDW
jgi:hypothetical protein